MWWPRCPAGRLLGADQPGGDLGHEAGRVLLQRRPGASVDEAALIERLADGSLAGAGLDVFATEPLPDDSPLWSMENVIVTPHMAGYTRDCANELCELFAANLASYGAHEPLRNVIDLSGAAA